jgi:predicted nuclease with TOPRIM domain
VSEETTQNLPQDGVRLILARLDSIDSRLDKVENRISNLETRLSALEDKVERRLHDTRPMWEQVLVRLDAFEKRLDGFEEELRSGLSRFGEQVKMLAEDVFEVRAVQRGQAKRMDLLESKAT